MSEENVPETDSSVEMQQEEKETASSHLDELPTETSSSENNLMEISDDPIIKEPPPKKLDNLQAPKDSSPSKLVVKVKSPSKLGKRSPSKSPAKIPVKRQSPSKPSKDVHSPSKKKFLEVITTEETTMEISSHGDVLEGRSDLSGLASRMGASQQGSSDHSAPNHVCGESCIHGGARPKTRALAHRSTGGQRERSRILEQMNRFAERMERSMLHNPECFGNASQQQWTGNIDNTNVFAEKLAGEMGHGPFVHNPSNTNYPSIVQLNRMFTTLNLGEKEIFESGKPQMMEQDPQDYAMPLQEPTISIDQVPESTRRMEVDEELSSSFPSWQVSEMETEPPRPMEQDSSTEQQVVVEEPKGVPQEPRQEYRLVPLRIRQMGPYIINPSHPYRQREEGRWRTAMMTAYRSERYHSKELLDDTMTQLEREGVSQEEFFSFYHSARRIDLYRDEGVEEIRSGPEREEITIEDKINKVIIAVGFMTVAMLYMRLYISRHPEIESSSESSTMDSGNVDRTESEPKTEYARLKEHVNVELGSSDNTDSPQGIDSPGGNNSPKEIQSPDFIPIPNRGSPVNILMPLSQVPKRSDTPSSQGSLIVESDLSGSSSSKKGLTLRKAVLVKSQSLDNTSGDASPILQDEETGTEEPKTFGQLMNMCLQAMLFVAAEDDECEVKDRVKPTEIGIEASDKDAGTGEADRSRCVKSEDDPGDETKKGDEEGPSKEGLESLIQLEDLKNEEMEGDVKETWLIEVKMEQEDEVSLDDKCEEKGASESDKGKEEKEETDSTEVKMEQQEEISLDDSSKDKVALESGKEEKDETILTKVKMEQVEDSLEDRSKEKGALESDNEEKEGTNLAEVKKEPEDVSLDDRNKDKGALESDKEEKEETNLTEVKMEQEDVSLDDGIKKEKGALESGKEEKDNANESNIDEDDSKMSDASDDPSKSGLGRKRKGRTSGEGDSLAKRGKES